MSIPKISTKEAKTLFAAHVFVFTSRGGLVISKLINVPLTNSTSYQNPRRGRNA